MRSAFLLGQDVAGSEVMFILHIHNWLHHGSSVMFTYICGGIYHRETMARTLNSLDWMLSISFPIAMLILTPAVVTT